MPGDVKGMKIRPANATISRFVSLLGGTNVPASAPESRDLLEKGVAEGITFPWGSIILFGIDKVTKYHLDSQLYVTEQTFVMNKDKYDALSPAQRKVIDDHCTPEWAEKIATPWADMEFVRPRQDQGAAGPGRLHDHACAACRMAQGRRAAESRVGSTGEEGRRRSGCNLQGSAGQPGEVQFAVLIAAPHARVFPSPLAGGARRRGVVPADSAQTVPRRLLTPAAHKRQAPRAVRARALEKNACSPP